MAERDPRPADLELTPRPDGPHGWIQWKGTNVCMDVHCVCGAHAHVDTDFCYFLRCDHCSRVYRVECNLPLHELSPEAAAYLERSASLIREARDEDEYGRPYGHPDYEKE